MAPSTNQHQPRQPIGNGKSPQSLGPVSAILHNGFAGLLQLANHEYHSPILAAATDGVGVKQVIAQQMGVYHTVGLDVVALVADDVVTSGARPLLLAAHLRVGEALSGNVETILDGVSEGCRLAGCEFVESDVDERRDAGREHSFDLSATGVGIVESDSVLGRARIRIGDVLVAMASSGLHANGFGVVRSSVLGSGRTRLNAVIEEVDHERTLGEVLLTPSRIYAADVLRLIEEFDVHALAHITGGGIAGNLGQVLPTFADAVVNRATWQPQPLFSYIAGRGRVYPDEMERNFNMGVGMIALLPQEEADNAVAVLTTLGQRAWVIGEVVAGEGRVVMVGEHAM